MTRTAEDYIDDILHFGARIVELGKGRTAADLDGDEMRAMTIVHYFQIIGEAVNRLPPQLKARIPEHDRIGVVDMRHHLVHGYFAVDMAVVVRSIEADLPRLIETIRSLSAPEGGS